MHVLLAAAPHADTFGYSMPPPGLLRLGGALERAGVAVRLQDLAFALAAGELPAGDALAQAAAERLLDEGTPDLLGLSVMGATLPIALAIAATVRTRAPNVRIALGGPGVGGVDRALVERFPAIDFVVRGEGEATLLELCARIASGASPAGVRSVTWRAGTSRDVVREDDRPPLADLAELAPHAWHLLPTISAYKTITGEDDGLVALDSGRGCVFDCSFCSIGRFWSRRSRPLPAPRLAAEMLELAALPGARRAYLCHDIFGADRAHALELCERLIAAGAPIAWEARARADHLDRDLCQAMRRAGCYRVLLGIESADPRVRRANQKGMRDDVDLLAVVDDCASAGITPILSLILGLPGEDERALAASLDFCADAALRAGVNLSLHLPNPQPGCALGDEHSQDAAGVEGVAPDMAWGSGQSAAERALIAAHPDLFTSFALLPGDAARWRALFELARELPEVLMRYPRTFALLRRRAACDALALWRRWKTTGHGFESFALDARDELIEESLRWEQAQVRVAARGAQTLLAAAPGHVPVVAGETFTARHDLAALAAALRRGEPTPAAGAAREHLVQLVPGALAAVRTTRLSPDAARMLASLAAGPAQPLAAWETRHPGISPVLARLAELGLVGFQSPSPTPLQPTR